MGCLLARHLANHAQKILAQDLLQVAFRISAFQQHCDQRRHLGNIVQSVRRPRDPIEIAPDPHVIDSRDLHGVVDVIGHVLHRRHHFTHVPKSFRTSSVA